MKKKIAFLTGINGQDGSYLSEHLLSLGYEVHGIIRRTSVSEHQDSRIHHLEGKIKTYYGDVLDQSCLEKLFREIQPDEIYNLAAQSHVRISFDNPILTFQINALGAMHVLEAYKNNCPNAKFYQASSSEMFGNSVDEDGFQRETTRMIPVSPYGCAKLAAYNLTNHYRESYGLFAVNGILFNHESPRRGSNFVTTKIIKTAVEIYDGLTDKLELGNLDSFRDWGHSKDYVRAMHIILNQDKPNNYVVSSQNNISVRQLCEYVFDFLKLDFEKYVTINEKYIRPKELKYLKGDSSQIRKLGWQPDYTQFKMFDDMIFFWMAKYDVKIK